MHGHVMYALRRLHHGFGDRWMSMHGSTQFVCSRFQLHSDTGLRDQFGSVWTNDVDAENLIVLLLRYDLHKALFFAQNACLARSREGKLSNLDVITQLSRFCLS